MKKLALTFSSKNRPELTRQTWPRLRDAQCAAFWLDGSTESNARNLFADEKKYATQAVPDAIGGPDRVIVAALYLMLKHPAEYTHVGLLENDVLLDPDWFEPTMRLFDYSTTEGLPVGAVSARAYEDRILIQRAGYGIMHNVGAGHVIFTRQAAQLILENYRTGWWPENRAVFSQLSGIDIGKYAAFGFNDQMITVDWSWDTLLAAHGLATVALTPSKATMIGQDIAEQGLAYAAGAPWPVGDSNPAEDVAFDRFRRNLIDIHAGKLAPLRVDHALQNRNGILTFSHHLAKIGGEFRGEWATKWNQACGPFVYVARANAGIDIMLFGACAFQVSGGRVSLRDEATGFSTEVDLTGNAEIVALPVPREYQTGSIHLEFGEGACFHGVETLHPQPQWRDVKFDYSKLPEVG